MPISNSHSELDPEVLHKCNDLKHIEHKLSGWFRELLGLGIVTATDDFFEIGGNSIVGMQLIEKINAEFETNLGLATLFDSRTVRELAARIVEAAGQDINVAADLGGVFVVLQPFGNQSPLFWIPGGYGSTVEPFGEVSRLLGTDRPVYGLVSKMPDPGKDMEGIKERSTRFVREIESFYPKGPYNLIGFCGGGFIAWEMAQQLTCAGKRVDFLALVDTYDPRYPSNWGRRVQFRIQHVSWRLIGLLGKGPAGYLNSAVFRIRKYFKSLAIFQNQLKTSISGAAVSALSETPAEAERRQMKVVYEYLPAPFSGSSFIFITSLYKFGGVSPSVDSRLIWRELSLDGSEVNPIPGDHLESLKGTNAIAFAKVLRDCLDRSRAV